MALPFKILGVIFVLLVKTTAAWAQPVFSKEIAPIIHQNCTPCHRQGGIAPFQLLQYGEVARRASMIAQVTGDRYMPPWPAGPEAEHFRNAKLLTEQEIDLIRQWAEAGAPEGKAKTYEAPSERTFGKAKNSFFVAPAQNFAVSGNNKDQFTFFLLPQQIEEDLNVTAFRFFPGNKKVVHHCELLAVPRENLPEDFPEVLTEESYFSETFYQQFSGELKYIAGWLPGNEGEIYPKRTGVQLKKGTRLLLMVHYAPSPVAAEDLTRVQIFTTPKALKRTMESFDLHGAEDIRRGETWIPADTVITFHAVREIREDFAAIAIFPHAHHLAIRIEAYAELAGDTIPLLTIPEWDFDWQYTYQFPRFIHLKKGTKVHFLATYDNTLNNPENPYTPPQGIPTSFNSNDEMMELFIWGFPWKPSDKDKKIRYSRGR